MEGGRNDWQEERGRQAEKKGKKKRIRERKGVRKR